LNQPLERGPALAAHLSADSAEEILQRRAQVLARPFVDVANFGRERWVDPDLLDQPLGGLSAAQAEKPPRIEKVMVAHTLE
jgi:hypothetical protein